MDHPSSGGTGPPPNHPSHPPHIYMSNQDMQLQREQPRANIHNDNNLPPRLPLVSGASAAAPAPSPLPSSMQPLTKTSVPPLPSTLVQIPGNRMTNSPSLNTWDDWYDRQLDRDYIESVKHRFAKTMTSSEGQSVTDMKPVEITSLEAFYAISPDVWMEEKCVDWLFRSDPFPNELSMPNALQDAFSVFAENPAGHRFLVVTNIPVHKYKSKYTFCVSCTVGNRLPLFFGLRDCQNVVSVDEKLVFVRDSIHRVTRFSNGMMQLQSSFFGLPGRSSLTYSVLLADSVEIPPTSKLSSSKIIGFMRSVLLNSCPYCSFRNLRQCECAKLFLHSSSPPQEATPNQALRNVYSGSQPGSSADPFRATYPSHLGLNLRNPTSGTAPSLHPPQNMAIPLSISQSHSVIGRSGIPYLVSKLTDTDGTLTTPTHGQENSAASRLSRVIDDRQIPPLLQQQNAPLNSAVVGYSARTASATNASSSPWSPVFVSNPNEVSNAIGTPTLHNPSPTGVTRAFTSPPSWEAQMECYASVLEKSSMELHELSVTDKNGSSLFKILIQLKPGFGFRQGEIIAEGRNVFAQRMLQHNNLQRSRVLLPLPSMNEMVSAFSVHELPPQESYRPLVQSAMHDTPFAGQGHVITEPSTQRGQQGRSDLMPQRRNSLPRESRSGIGTEAAEVAAMAVAGTGTGTETGIGGTEYPRTDGGAGAGPSTSPAAGPSSVETQPNSTAAKKLVCTICNSMFRFPSHLREHERVVHLKLKDYKCEYCGNEYGTKGNLRQHIKNIHEKVEESFYCEICNRHFKYKNKYKIHMAQLHNS